jgi:hypothetical protein
MPMASVDFPMAPASQEAGHGAVPRTSEELLWLLAPRLPPTSYAPAASGGPQRISNNTWLIHVFKTAKRGTVVPQTIYFVASDWVGLNF